MDRRLRSAATLGVLAMLCVVGVVVGVQQLTAELPSEPIVTAPPVCEPRPVKKGDVVRPGQVVVSVFNAGTEAGQAGRTMRALIGRGFVAADSGNAPQPVDVKGAQVWVTGPVNPAAQLVARQFGRGTKIRADAPELGPGVVVVVGNDHGKLAKVRKQVKVKADSEICSPPVTD